MVRTFLVRGMLVGIVAGLLSFAFLKVYGEPQVDRAVAFETQQDEAKAAARKAESHNHASASHDHASEAHTHMADHDEPELVSRSVQAGLGLFVAVLVYSAAFGGLFGLAFAFAYGRTSSALTPQALSAVLAATGFVAIYLVPTLKYPANPPAVGEPETIGIRTALYFVMIAISLAAMIASLAIKRLLLSRGLANGTPIFWWPPATSCWWESPPCSSPPSMKCLSSFQLSCCGTSASHRSEHNSLCGRRLACCSEHCHTVPQTTGGNRRKDGGRT